MVGRGRAVPVSRRADLDTWCTISSRTSPDSSYRRVFVTVFPPLRGAFPQMRSYLVFLTAPVLIMVHFLQIGPPTHLLCSCRLLPVDRCLLRPSRPIDPMPQGPPDDPITTVDHLLLLALVQRRNDVAALEPPQHDVVLGSGEVDEAVASKVSLGTWRSGDAVDVGAQEAVGELGEGVAEVDNGVARERSHVAPLGVTAGWEDLEAAKAVEEDADCIC